MSVQDKRLVVELFGPATRIAGVTEVELELAKSATFRDMMRALATSYPDMRGPVIDPGSWSLTPHFFLSLEGRETIREYDREPQPGARLLLMSAIVGG